MAYVGAEKIESKKHLMMVNEKSYMKNVVFFMMHGNSIRIQQNRFYFSNMQFY